MAAPTAPGTPGAGSAPAARPGAGAGPPAAAAGVAPASTPSSRPARPATPAPETPEAARTREAVERAAEVLRQIRLQLRAGVPGANEVLLHLSPADLGRLTIRMRLQDGRLSTLVRVESPQTLELLERQAPELRALLAQEGYDTERLELELAGQGGRHAFERGAEHGLGARSRRGVEAPASSTAPASERASNDLVAELATGDAERDVPDRVDTFA